MTFFRKNFIWALLVGFFIAVFVNLGHATKLYHGFSFSTKGLVTLIVSAIFMLFVFWGLFILIDKIVCHKERSGGVPWINRKISKSNIYYFVMVCAILLLWLPSLLAFYPGLYAYDASWQCGMYMENRVTAHHPVIHTYLLGWVIDTVYNRTQSFNKGILAYTLVQEIIMAVECGTVFYLFHKRQEKMWKHIFALVFYASFPIFVIFVFTSTKDSIFAIATAVFVLLNLMIAQDDKRFFEDRVCMVLWVIYGLQVAIFRNNAIYALVVSLPFFVFLIIKSEGNKKNAFVMLGTFIVLFLLYKYPYTNAVTVEGTSKAEMLSVPCQQIIRVSKYHGDELTEKQWECIDTLFDPDKWYGYYVPEIADATKGSLRLDVYESDSSLFWDLWAELLREYPNEYLDSVLENTYGFWYPWPHYIIYPYGDEGYTPITCNAPGELNTKLPMLFEFYKKFENGDIVQNNHWLSWIFSPAIYMYLALIIGVYLLKMKRIKECVPVLFLALLWCTYLLGPVAMIRYALYLVALVPIWPTLVKG